MKKIPTVIKRVFENNKIVCKDCRCYQPVLDNDRYCGECCIGDTRNPIAINANIAGCCLYETKQPDMRVDDPGPPKEGEDHA